MNLNNYIGREFDAETWNCWILCQTVLKNEASILVPTFSEHVEDIKNFKKLSKAFKHEQEQEEVWHEIEPGKEKQFDIVLMRIRSLPIHVGIVIEPGWMLHVEEDTATVTENYTRIKWKHRVIGFYRHQLLVEK